MPLFPPIIGLLATALSALAYGYMMSGYFRLRALGLETLDLWPQYDFPKASATHDQLVTATGEGAALYRHLLGVDLAFPPLFALALIYWIDVGGLPHWLSALAVIGALADIAENLLLWRMLDFKAGALWQGLSTTTAVATTIKLSCCLVALLGVIVGLLWTAVT